jgi:hypothetical protein
MNDPSKSNESQSSESIKDIIDDQLRMPRVEESYLMMR